MWLAALALADPAAPPVPEVGPAFSAPPSLLQAALALLFTCLLAAVVLRLLLPQRGRAPRGLGGGEALRLVARLPLGEAQAVYLLRAAGRYLLVGGSPGGLTLLTELEPAEAERALQAEGAAPGPAGLLGRLGLAGGREK